MSDAVVLFHPAQRDALLPFLDLDEDENEDSDGVYAEELEDGSFLLYTFQPYELFAENQEEARTWLAQFGDDLGAVHDDPRGALFFPDTLEPEAQTYDGVVAEVANEGMFVMTSSSPLAAAMAGIDPNLLQALADQLLGGAAEGGDPKAALPFDIGKLIEGFQGQMLASLGAQARDDESAEDEEEEEHDDDAPKPEHGAEATKPPSKKPAT